MKTRLVLPLLLAGFVIALLRSAEPVPPATGIDAEDLLARFCRYVQIDTGSIENAKTVPSTPGQWDLLRLLERELREIGATEVVLTGDGILLATIPATSPKPGVPVLAWLAHVDTVSDPSGAAKPIVHRAYDGKLIVLPDDPAQVLDPATDAILRAAAGQDIVTASGKTVLGADDKAGVAVIMATARHLLRHPEISHGKIRLCFTPDEEVGGGIDKLDLAQLGAAVGYTLDGGARGEICAETFSADQAKVEIRGVATHPGEAKDVMVNALRLAARYVDRLPMELSPERNAGRDGFIHPFQINGNDQSATVRMLLRDFELDGLAAKRALVKRVAVELRAAEPRARIDVIFKEEYRNMRYWLEREPRPVEFMQEAVRRAGIVPILQPARGGTDGSALTARGLPTPDLFTGMQGYHSLREWVSVQDMTCAAQVLVHLAQVWLERGTELKKN